ncbi:DUF2155 domain-containing protein [uncultured Thalassospira sp.]|jgi:hypothetical protein|uniref:DUF2155 domain-containing protein n=1 Tax=uncultured Thalassospira sp. TaxID=404382 RepID=UPI0030D8F952|tara:strand:+ start:7740 stop:8183 length:444 start_codon:yes stop_codon:yes gene_type:complete
MKAQILLVTGVLAAGFGVAGGPDASALDYRKSEVAQLQGLDKITARISTFDVPVGQSVNFGSLTIKVDACYRTPPEERPESAGFLEITDHRSEDKTDVKVFDGWMFASTPGLSALEHPVYDVWVKECMEPSDKSPKAGDAMPSENNG